MSKSLIGILTFTFITVIGWIGFEIYHSYKNVDYPTEYQNLTPINDYLDIETLDAIDARQQYEVYNPFSTEKLTTNMK